MNSKVIIKFAVIFNDLKIVIGHNRLELINESVR